MKRVKNRSWEERAIRKSLELPAVPEIINERLRQVYGELPEQLPKKRPRPVRPLKAAAGAVSGLAAAFLLLFGLNGLNPALAETLPLIGGVFQQLNQSQGWVNLTETQLRVEQYAESMEGVEAQVPANGLLERPMKVTVRETYFDGEFLYAGLSMEINTRDDRLFSRRSPGYDVLLDGVSQLKYDEEAGDIRGARDFILMGDQTWQPSGSGEYLSQVAFHVPEQYRDLERLDVTLQYSGIYAFQNAFELERNSSPFTLSFTAKKNTARVKRIEGGAEKNGIRLVSAAASPAGTVYTLEIPPEYVNPANGPIFEDGCAVGALGNAWPQTTEEGWTRLTSVFGGLREAETRKIVYSVFDKNNTDEYVAVFLLDFEAGTAELGTEKDIKRFTPAAYCCGEEEIRSFPGDYKISLASHKGDGNYLLLFVETKDAHPKTARLEIWQEGSLLGSRVEKQDKRFYDEHQYVNAAGDTVKTETNRYVFGIVGMEALDPAKPVTVKLFDARSEEQLMEETIVLTQEKD